MKKYRLLLTFLFSLLLFYSNGNTKVTKGEIKLTVKAIHPLWRTDPFPANMDVDVNPPAFFWPSTRIEFTEPLKEYNFELAKDKQFKQIIESSKKQNPSFYVAKKPLSLGTFYWRYRESGKKWQGPYSITITKDTRLDKRPTAQEFVKAVTGPRPRMLVKKQNLNNLREKFKKNGRTKSICKEADKYFDVVLPEKQWGGEFYKNGQRVFKPTKFPDDHVKSKITAPVFQNAVTSLCKAYLLTGDLKYGKEANRWGQKITTYEIMPENKTTYDGNPYPDGFALAQYMNTMAYVYDSLYDLMTVKERNNILKYMAKQLHIYYEYYCNRLENRCIDNHAWQISLGCFIRAAITAKGNLPEAEKYLAYIHDIWTARDPEQGRTDGGFFAGGYMSVNIGVWRSVPVLFRNFTGYNYYQHPFYNNQPVWLFYRQPPGSTGDGFNGDGYGSDRRGLSESLAVWMDFLDVDLNLLLAGWLSDSVPAKRKKKFQDAAWERLAANMPLKNSRKAPAPKKMLQAHAFQDVGVVNMHRDILNPENDLHVALRSSPYGTFGHNLASHNAFNVVYKGAQLFLPYGNRHGGYKNNVACYRHTRGHNSVLVDGKGQPFSPEAYGWIARYLHGKQVTYACGDASNAYVAAPFERETTKFAQAELKIDEHISRGVVERFRRHLLFLRPSLILVYDELEANKKVRWDWVLHCRHMMTKKGTVLSVEGVKANADIRASSPMSVTIKDKPIFPAINVDGRGKQPRGTPYPIMGSHAYVSSVDKVLKLRVLGIVQVGDFKPVTKKDNTLTCGNWVFTPEMDTAKPANLEIHNTDKTVSFTLKIPEKGESVLSEVIDGEEQVQRVVDEVPYVARGFK